MDLPPIIVGLMCSGERAQRMVDARTMGSLSSFGRVDEQLVPQVTECADKSMS